MNTTRNTAQAQGVHLIPVFCEDEQQVLDAAFDGIRRRPVVARNADGELIVCCSRTAKKHGWKIEGRLFVRNPERKATPKTPKAPATKTPKAPVTKPAAKKVARVNALASLEEMLGGYFGEGAVKVV
jgi:hypothetical protein